VRPHDGLPGTVCHDRHYNWLCAALVGQVANARFGSLGEVVVGSNRLAAVYAPTGEVSFGSGSTFHVGSVGRPVSADGPKW
jgi:hypothetical protein